MRDEDRPMVLAHQRFLAEREVMKVLPLAERFTRIHETNLWGATTSSSGLGSEHAATEILRSALPAVLAKLAVRTLLDAPCGDAGWIMATNLGDIRYAGADIVPAIVERNHAERNDAALFFVADITCDPLPSSDAILCRDCLVHLSFANISRTIENFRRSGATWLLTTTFPGWRRNRDCEDGDWRAINFELLPFCWPEPWLVLNEGCDEAGGGWRDKSLAAWRLADLP